VNEPGGWHFLAYPFVDEEADPLLHPDPSCGNAAILEDLRDPPVRTFVFFPSPNVRPKADYFSRATFFEPGHHPSGFTLGGKHHSESALAASPASAGEVEQTRSALEKDSVDFVLPHQAAGLFHSRSSLVLGDRLDTGDHWLESSNRVGDLGHRRRGYS